MKLIPGETEGNLPNYGIYSWIQRLSLRCYFFLGGEGACCLWKPETSILRVIGAVTTRATYLVKALQSSIPVSGYPSYFPVLVFS